MKKSGKIIFELILAFAIFFTIFYVMKLNNQKENSANKVILATQDSSLITEAKEKGKNTNIIYEIKEDGEKLVIRVSLDGKKAGLKGAVEVIETYAFSKEENKMSKEIIFDSIYSANAELDRRVNKYEKADLNKLYTQEETIQDTKKEIIEAIQEDCEYNNLYCRISK